MRAKVIALWCYAGEENETLRENENGGLGVVGLSSGERGSRALRTSARSPEGWPAGWLMYLTAFYLSNVSPCAASPFSPARVIKCGADRGGRREGENRFTRAPVPPTEGLRAGYVSMQIRAIGMR